MAEAALVLSIKMVTPPPPTPSSASSCRAIIVHASVSECSRISTYCTLQQFPICTLTTGQKGH